MRPFFSLLLLVGISFFTVSQGWAFNEAFDPVSELGHFSAKDADRFCRSCSKQEKAALQRLFNARSTPVRSVKGGAVYEFGVAIQDRCLEKFGPSFPEMVQLGLAQGAMCMGSSGTPTTTGIIKELATVLAAEQAPLPQVLCTELSSKDMKGVAFRSRSPKMPPKIVLSPVMAKRPEQEIRSVVFHEFIHLGGAGHSHGTQRELATPCQYCCFDATPYARFTQPQACRVCVSDYSDKYDEKYLKDLAAWAVRTPGNEHLFRINYIDGVRRANGEQQWFVDLLRYYKDHPFGFQLARKLKSSFTWQGKEKKLVRKVARKRHGHVTKRYIAFADVLSEALILRFAAGNADALSADVAERMTELLEKSALPDRNAVPKLDVPFFFKYYYEFALMRGVLVEELADYWDAESRKICSGSGNAGGGAAVADSASQACVDTTKRRDVFWCQQKGLDYDFANGQCLKVSKR